MIYEVNLTVNNEIYEEYQQWLLEHIKEILQFPGFLKAEVLKEKISAEEDQQVKKISVRYFLVDENSLNNYLDQHASTLRAKAIAKFGKQFSAHRRFFLPAETIVFK